MYRDANRLSQMIIFSMDNAYGSTMHSNNGRTLICSYKGILASEFFTY